MAIRKRKTKQGIRYQAIVFWQQKRVATRTFKKQGDAKDWHDTQVQRLKGDPEALERDSFRFEQLIDLYRTRHLRNRSQNTQDRYNLEINERLLPYFSGWQMTKITVERIEDLRNEQVDAGARPRSVNMTLEVLRAIINKGIKWGYLKTNPVSQVDFLDVVTEERDWLKTVDEINRVMAEAQRSVYYPMMLLGLEAGLRVGEVLGLSPEDFDFEARMIRVERQWLDRVQDYGPPKHKLIRYVPMSKSIAQVLQPLMTESPFVFRAPGGKPPRQSSVYDGVSAITERAIGRKLGLHALRHTFGSWYMKRFDDMWTLSRLMGHSSITTTRKYCHHGGNNEAPSLDLWEHSPNTRHTVASKDSFHKETSSLAKCSGRDLNTPTLYLVG